MSLIKKLVGRINEKHSSTASFYSFDPMGHSKFYLSALEWVLSEIEKLKVTDGLNDWIRVDGKKPDNNTKVIAYFQHEKNKLFNTTQLTIFNERYFDDTGHWLNWGDDGNPQYRVTHWHPLPEPPKE